MRNISILLVWLLLPALHCSKPPAETAPATETDGAPSVRFEETVATVDPMGHPVTAEGSNGTSPFRLLPGRKIRTVQHAAVHLDNGVSLLLDTGTEMLVTATRTELLSGRAWVRARTEKDWDLTLPGGRLSCREAAFNITISPDGVLLHHLEGELNVHYGPKPERLRGGTFLLGAEGPRARPTELWTDWTGGLFRAGRSDSGYGVLTGRPRGPEGLGQGGTPLILRRQKVNVRIRRRTAITEVEQVFFNPSSVSRDADYRVRIPAGSVIMDASISRKSGVWISPSTLPVGAFSEVSTDGIFFQTGEAEFGALMTDLPPAEEVGIRLTYVQTLSDVGGRRLYRYPMSGGARAAEFELGLRVLESDARLRSGWEGAWENQQFMVRRSDFLPLSDFVAEVFPRSANEPLFEVEKDPGERASFLLSIPLEKISKMLPSTTRIPEPAVVFLLDMSASMDSSRIQVLKTAFASLFEKMNEKTRVAVFVLRGDVTALDDQGLAPLNSARRERFLEQISRLNPAGATDLGLAIERATVLIPNGEGLIVYVGDGKPTRGPMIASRLASRLSMSSPSPLFASILLGKPDGTNILSSLGRTFHVEEVGDLSARAGLLLQELEAAAFKDIRVDLGPSVSRTTPVHTPSAEINSTLFIKGFAEKLPEKAIVSGFFGSRSFSVVLPLSPVVTTDTEVLRKLWAASRLEDLIARGAGFEAIAQLATEYRMVTPYTGYSFFFSGSSPEFCQIPENIFQELPRLPEYQHVGLRNMPPSSISGLSLPDLEPPVHGFSLEMYYRSLLNSRDRMEAVNQCYQRKAVFAPMTGGTVLLELVVGNDGRFQKIELKNSTLTDATIPPCIIRALNLSPPLPPPPSGQPVTIGHTYSFVSTGQVLPQECSRLSRATVEERRRAWRQKMPYNGNAWQAEQLYRAAQSACELESWIDRRAILEVILQRMQDIRQKLALVPLLSPEGSAVSGFLREQILRTVKTTEEARWVVQTLSLHGGNLYGSFLAELDRWHEKDGKKLTQEAQERAIYEFARKWQKLDPENAALSLFVMRSAIPVKQTDVALVRGQELLHRNDLTAGQREELAELYMKLENPILAQLAISTSVELAPHDPWTRKRLGDFYRRHGLLTDALAEYEFLSWLLPQAPEPRVLIAETLLARGNWELGLQGYEHLLHRHSFAPTRHLFAIRLAQLAGHPEIPADGWRTRVRRNGLLDDTGSMLVFVRNLEGQAQLLGREGGFPQNPDKDEEDYGAVGTFNRVLGITLAHHPEGRDQLLRFFQSPSGGTRFLPPARYQLIIVRDLWKETMTIHTMEITNRPGFYQYIHVPGKGDIPEPRFTERKIPPPPRR